MDFLKDLLGDDYGKSLEGDLAAVKEKGLPRGILSDGSNPDFVSFCIDSFAAEYLKLPFDDFCVYKVYFILKSAVDSFADSLCVYLDKDFLPLTVQKVDKSTIENVFELSGFIDKNAPADARRVIVSKYTPDPSFESGLFFASELSNRLTSLKLHDYVLVTRGYCKSVMNSFR